MTTIDSRAGHGGLVGVPLKITSVITFQGNLGRLTFGLSDGRTVSVPTAWNEKIDSTPNLELAKFEIVNGNAVSWPKIGVTITLQELLHPFQMDLSPSREPAMVSSFVLDQPLLGPMVAVTLPEPHPSDDDDHGDHRPLAIHKGD
jgi:hypothetical protein